MHIWFEMDENEALPEHERNFGDDLTNLRETSNPDPPFAKQKSSNNQQESGFIEPYSDKICTMKEIFDFLFTQEVYLSTLYLQGRLRIAIN